MEPYGCRTTKAVRILKSELSFPNPMFRPHLAALFSLTLASSQAVEIRAYSSARHDRFVVDGGGIAFNPDAYYVSSRYSGVGFATDGGDPRQYTLVTPEHVLFARHYLPANGTNIRFLNAFGQEFNRTTISSSAVPNGSGGFADVIIIKLSSPLPADQGITPSFRAMATAWVRLRAPSLRLMLRRWVRTVLSLTKSLSAMAPLL